MVVAFMPEKVLVTGACGFIGSHLLPMLIKQGYEVIALDNRYSLVKALTENYDEDISKIQADICDDLQMDDLAKRLHFDSIIHLAAMAAPRVAETKLEETFRVNVYGTYNVLKLGKAVNVKRIVFASSAHVYGISPKYIPTDEFHPLALLDGYTSSKIIGEQLCQLFYENHNVSYVTLRMFNGYGPRQSLDYFIPAMLEQAKNGQIILRGRDITKDFIYVDDIADAMVKALSSRYVGSLNVGTGIQTTLEYVASYIAKAFNANLTFAETQDRGPTHMQCDNSRIKATLGWSPKISIDEGLSKTIEWFKSIG